MPHSAAGDDGTAATLAALAAAGTRKVLGFARHSRTGKVLSAVLNVVLLIAAAPLIAVMIAWLQLKSYAGHFFHRLSTEGPLNLKKQRRQHLVDSVRFAAQPEHPALAQSATTIALYIKAGKYTSEEVMRAFIRQASRVQTCMNVIKDERYALAIAEAQAVDAVLRQYRASSKNLDELPPFFGVPCSVKEVFAVPGLRQTGGTWWRRDYRATTEASPITRLRKAGFVLFCVTTIPELGMWYETLWGGGGRSSNAYDHRRIVGGSSGGEAALISAAGAPCGIGSDIGGSIRMPSAFNGVWGHKPTGGLVSNAGQYPTTNNSVMTTGPICRYSDDLLPMLELLRGPDGIDTACVPMQLVEVDLPLARRIKESVSASVHGTSRRTMRLMGKELAEATHGEAAEAAAASRISKAVAAALASGGGSPPAGAPHGAGVGGEEEAGDLRVGRVRRALSGASSSSSDEDASSPPVSSGSASSNGSGNKLLLVDRTRSQSEGSGIEGDLEEMTRRLLDAPLLQREGVLRADAAGGVGGCVGGGVSTPGGEAVAQGVSAAAVGKPEDVAAAVPFAGGEPAGLRRRGRAATRGSSGEPTAAAAGPMPRRRSGGTADALNIISGSSSASLASLEALHGPLGAGAAGIAGTSSLGSAASGGIAAGAAPGPTAASALAETGQHLGSPSPVASRLSSRPAITKWSDVTVWLIEDIDAVRPVLSTPIQGSIRKAMNVAAQCLVDTYGCKGVRYLKLPELINAFDLWSAVLTQAEQPSFADLMAEGYGGTLDVGIELFKWCFGQSTSTLPALLLALVEDLPGKLAPARTRRLVQEAMAVRERVKDILTSTNGVLLCPVHPTTAPLHDIPLTRFFNVAYTQLFNVLLTPCTVVPMGLDGEGLPVGIQVVGAPAFDRLTIAVAQALEHAGVGGWVPPSAVGDCPHCRFDGASDRPGAVSPPVKRAPEDSNSSNDSGTSGTSGALASATVPAERALEAALANGGAGLHKA